MPIDQFESKHRAFLKVQDGCNQFCSYCIIPYARGRERSLSSQEVIAIAKDLEEKGHIEIVLTGIHTGRYYDEKEKLDLAGLLKNCWKIRGTSQIPDLFDRDHGSERRAHRSDEKRS